MRRSIARVVKVLPLAVALLAAAVLLGGCYPKSQVYGVCLLYTSDAADE